MALIDVTPEDGVLFSRGFGRHGIADDIAIAAQQFPERLCPLEARNRNADRDARRASVAGGPIGDVLRPPEPALCQCIVKLARIRIDQMGKHLSFLLAFEIGAGCRCSYEKLRKISALNTQSLVFRLIWRGYCQSMVQMITDYGARVKCAALIVNKAIMLSVTLLTGAELRNLCNIWLFAHVGDDIVCMVGPSGFNGDLQNCTLGGHIEKIALVMNFQNVGLLITERR